MTNKGFEVFNIGEEQLRFELDDAKKILKAKLDPTWIKQRSQGKTTLSYIGGNTVIHLLNAAFNYQWSFEIVSEEVVQSVPKPVTQWNNQSRRNEKVMNPDGTVKMEEQPPYLKVLGRLTVPGLGVREQYGSKIFIGGATEQESAFKSASTDAMKKCASLFGIGLELYGDEEYNFDEVAPATPSQPVQPVVAPTPSQPVTQSAPVSNPKPAPQTPRPATPPAQPAQAQTASAGATNPNTWDQNDINRLKELKAILGITDNAQLDPYVREFLDNKDMTYMNITPQNVKAFNIFLAKKAETV
jgi:hypothetical protein